MSEATVPPIIECPQHGETTPPSWLDLFVRFLRMNPGIHYDSPAIGRAFVAYSKLHKSEKAPLLTRERTVLDADIAKDDHLIQRTFEQLTNQLACAIARQHMDHDATISIIDNFDGSHTLRAEY